MLFFIYSLIELCLIFWIGDLQVNRANSVVGIMLDLCTFKNRYFCSLI